MTVLDEIHGEFALVEEILAAAFWRLEEELCESLVFDARVTRTLTKNRSALESAINGGDIFEFDGYWHNICGVAPTACNVHIDFNQKGAVLRGVEGLSLYVY